LKIGFFATPWDRRERFRAMSKEYEYEDERSWFARLGISGWLAIFGLILFFFGFFPELGLKCICAVDFRNWSQLTWFIVNGIVVVGLIIIVAKRRQN
jgi:hypothetical protein